MNDPQQKESITPVEWIGLIVLISIFLFSVYEVITAIHELY